MKKAPPDRTYAHRLASYDFCVFASNIGGAGLLGLIACVAAGAIDSESSVLRSCFFLFICVGAIVIGGCRFHCENKANEIKIRIDRTQVGKDDPLSDADKDFTPSVFSYLVVFCAAAGIPAAVLILGVWAPIVKTVDPASAFLYASIVVILGPVVGVVSWKFIRVQKDQDMSSQNTDDQAQYVLLLRIYEEIAKRAKVYGLALLGHIACIAAGVFAGVSDFYKAALFTAIVFSGHNFGFHRLLCERAALQIRRDIEDGAVHPSSKPRFVHAISLLMFDQDIFFYSTVAPPLILLAGVFTSLFFAPFRPITAYFSVFWVGATIFGCFNSWWKFRQFNMLWDQYYKAEC